MKKQKKKLVLAKETVRSLSRAALGEVAGGTQQSCYCTVGCWSNPDYSCLNEFAPTESRDC